MKEFNVKWSKSVRLTSAITFIVLAGACVALLLRANASAWNYLFVACIVAAILYCAYMSPLKITADNEKITIKKIIGNKSIRFEKIEKITLFQANSMHSVRLLGSGGFLGYTGLHYNPQIGRYASFVGSYDQTILIETGGGMKYLISCEHAEELVKHYNSLISMS